jgi:transposase
LDLHRRQITFDALEVGSGEEWRGRIWQPDRDRFRRWLHSDLARRVVGGSVALAVEGCTGWRYVVEEIEAAGFEAHLAEPDLQLSPAGRQRITVGYRMIDATDAEAQPLKRDLQRFGVKQPACKALVDAQYGIGGLIAVAVWSELGDCRRFCRSEQAVRHTGLDISVDSSDRRRGAGFLSRQGPQTLRWALYEAAKNSSHRRSPDHDFYTAVKARHDGKIAAISVARKLARRCYHVLRSIDPELVYAIPA